MPGSKKCGETLRQTMIKKYGSEEAWKAVMREYGRKGGSVSTPTGGFAANPELARIAGAKAGKLSKRNHRFLRVGDDGYAYYVANDTGKVVKYKHESTS